MSNDLPPSGDHDPASSVGSSLTSLLQGGGRLKQRKNRLIGGVAACLFCILGGWIYGVHVATSLAKDEIDGRLLRAHLSDSITYRDLSASPLGSVTLSDVTLTLSPGRRITIHRLKLAEIDRNAPMPRHFSLSWSGAVIPLAEMATEPSMIAMVGTGFAQLQSDGRFAFRYEPSRQTLEVTSEGSLQHAGDWGLDLSLGDLAPGFFAVLDRLQTQQGMKFNPLMMMFDGTIGQATASLTMVTLRSLSFSLDMSQLAARMREIPNAALPDDDEMASSDAAPMVSERRLVEGGMSPSEAKTGAAALNQFAVHGGKFTVRANPGSPVALFPDGNLLSSILFNPGAFLAATHGHISN